MIQTINKAALYARYSSDNQRSESIDAQLRAMQNYCQQNHILIVETYIDEAKSATTDHRPSFQKMIADSKYHQFNIILVHKLDRFARNRYDSAVYKRELKKNGVSVYSVLENLDDSPESIMMESVLEGMSEYYSQNLAREVMKGMRETALQCKHTGGKPPLGYDLNTDGKLIINQGEAEVVQQIFKMYLDNYSYSKMAEILNKKGYRTKTGSLFRKNSFYSILRQEKYTGVISGTGLQQNKMVCETVTSQKHLKIRSGYKVDAQVLFLMQTLKRFRKRCRNVLMEKQKAKPDDTICWAERDFCSAEFVERV